jgi:UDP:flavonoid glycosyltransferase YjiC (YdhE family)
LRLLLGAFGDPGHAFPMLALGERLVSRGHDVVLQTWAKWREYVEAGGMRCAPAGEYQVFPTRDKPLKPYAAVVRAAREMAPLVESVAPDVVVADILTLAPALAAEVAGVPVATVIPHVYPVGAPGFPPYALGARLPRTALGRAGWNALRGPVGSAERRGRDELNETRRRLGLAPQERVHGGLSDRLVLVGTFPQLEYPRDWPSHVHVVGPLLWEPPFDPVEPPPGSDPVVVVAPSTSQDPQQRMLRAAVKGLGRARVRALATWNRRPPPAPLRPGPNTRLVEWISYSKTFPRAAVVVCHAGHGTLVRALHSGAVAVAVPVGADMGENAARLDWAKLGVRLPGRLVSPATVRLAVARALDDAGLAERVRALGAWSAAHDGPTRAAELIEGLASSTPNRGTSSSP